MVSSQFGAILKDLEPVFNCTLEPDANNACLIQLKSGVEVQLELTRHGDLLIGAKLGVIPRSHYLENVLRVALQANHLHFSSLLGIFGYSQKSNQLILFTLIDSRSINPDRIAATIVPFLNKAKTWADAIKSGNIPTISEEETSRQAPRGLFGLAK